MAWIPVATRPSSVRVFAPAKINLFLHVVGRRADGYHDLESLVAFADVGDVLTIASAQSGISLNLEGPFAGQLSADRNNLVLKAARAVADLSGLTSGATFSLLKELPVASGIGGGSADAAAAIRGLAFLWNLSTVKFEELLATAATIGSDVPVCIQSATAWMTGRGERVVRLPDLPKSGIVLVNPGVSISTADVFRQMSLQREIARGMPDAQFVSFENLLAWLDHTGNHLQPAARRIAPAIGDVIDALTRHGAALARMSGSGATCFGLFSSRKDAELAAAGIARAESGWWVRATEFVSPDAAEPQAQ